MDIVFNALDGRSNTQDNKGLSNGNGINYRDEPVAFFFVLYGVVVEALLARSSTDGEGDKEEILCLLPILKKIIRPSVSGQAIYQEAIFSETMDLLNRLVLTQGLAVQIVVVEIASDLCLSHPSSRTGQRSANGSNA